MTKIATRYILAEHIGPFFFGFVVINFVLIMDFILKILNLILSRGLPTLVILEVFVLNLAWMLALSVPMSVLVAVLMAFGRLSADMEITAFKANGVPFYRLLLPVLIVAAIIAGGMMLFNDKILPESNHRARVLMSDITRKKPAWNIEPGVFIDAFPGYNILIQKVHEDQIHIEGVTIYDKKNRQTPRTIVAKRGTIGFLDDRSTLKIDLENGEIHERDEKEPDKYRRLKFKNQSLYIENAGNQLVRSDSKFRGDREKSVSMMKQDQKELTEKIDNAYEDIKTRMEQAFALIEGSNGDEPVSDINYRLDASAALNKFRNQVKKLGKQIGYEEQNIDSWERQYNALAVEIHKKFAIPVACIVFVLLGGPLGVMARKGGMGTGLGLSLLFFILYWAFLIGGEELADRTLISPFVAMWSANILLGLTGIYLLIKTVKESVFIRFSVPKIFMKRLPFNVVDKEQN